MNGFANSLLSVLLIWIRALVANIWAIINSEDGGVVYRFFAQNWKALLLALLIGGIVIDRVIYLIRWRPHYVWLSRLDKIRSQKKRASEAWSEPDPVPGMQHMPAAQPQPEPLLAPAAAESTTAYAPLRQACSEPAEVYAQVYEPVEEEPVFDEPVAQWEESEDWPEQTLVNYGRPRPEPIAYYRDVQAGFAPAIPPEQLYAPRVQMNDPLTAPVHPGLDEETFRQNVGLEEQLPQPVPVMRAPAFRPFTAMKEEELPPAKQSAFSRLARRARDLVGGDDEDKPLTYRDLHSTVDVSQAFHEPVYPQSMRNNE